MSDAEQTEMVEQPTGETPEAKGLDEIQAELKRTADALRKANAEAAKYRHQASKFEQEMETKRQAEMTEMEKLQEALHATSTELATLKAREIKRAVAARAGLPEALAYRLQGETEEELLADAESLKETLPKMIGHQAPTIPAANPGTNAKEPALTDKQKLARLYSSGADVFDPVWAAQHGGGVIGKD